jgi:hypothetical protein
MDSISPNVTIAPKRPQLLRGKARMNELRAAAEAERRTVEADLLRDLGHEASATERIAVEILSAQVVRGRRMRAAGRHTEAEMAERLALRGLAKLGIRGKQKPNPQKALLDYLASRQAASPIAQPGETAPGQQADEARTSEAGNGACEVSP